MMKLATTVLLVIFQLLLVKDASSQCSNVCAYFGSTGTADCSPRPEVVGEFFQFTVIPPDCPVDTRILIMSGNALTTILPGNLSAYPLLETLVLNDNLFTELPETGLNVSQLTNLTLDGNPLTSLGPGRLSGLSSLQHLYIRRTPLSTINGSAFEGLGSLLNLFIDDNQLTSFLSNLLEHIPQIRYVSLTGNDLQTLPEGIFDLLNTTVTQVDLSDNLWSCDCYLQPLAGYLNSNPAILASSVTCSWPPEHQGDSIASPSPDSFECYAPRISQGPRNTTLLSNRTLTITCDIRGAPFPEVTWTQDGVPVNYTDRVHISSYSASLVFERLELSDSGEYQCSVENVNGTAESNSSTITILEWTCFNEVLSSHETDIDCGGEFCDPCNITQGCRDDRDCIGELVCLYSHQLPSTLHYISQFNEDAYTCADQSVPPILLEAILQEELPTDIYSVNISGLDNSIDLQNMMHDLLALQLQVTRSTISNVLISTVEKYERPLVQIYFNLARNSNGELARSKLLDQVNSGALKATARITEESNAYKVRLNI